MHAAAGVAGTGGPHLQASADDISNIINMPTTISMRGGEASGGDRRSRAMAVLSDIAAGGADDSTQFRVRTSSKFARSFDKDWFVLAFPYLFPFGRGGLDEARSCRVSRAACLRHYMHLSSGAFQGYEFVLHAYDLTARMQVNYSAFTEACFKPSATDDATRAERFARLSKEDAQAGSNYMAALIKARRRHARDPPPPPTLSANAVDFFRSISRVAAAAKHTDEYAFRNRSHAHAMHHTFGKPSWWFTLSLDDTCNIELWLMSTGDLPGEPPPRSRRLQILNKHPGLPCFTILLFFYSHHVFHPTSCCSFALQAGVRHLHGAHCWMGHKKARPVQKGWPVWHSSCVQLLCGGAEEAVAPHAHAAMVPGPQWLVG